jgi:hypothetical protein
LLAADRLEAALERLAVALEARLEQDALEARLEQNALEVRLEQDALQARLKHDALEARFAEPLHDAGDMVPRAEVEKLSARLDEALRRLRLLLGEDAGDDI